MFQALRQIDYLTVIQWPPLYCLAARHLIGALGDGVFPSDRGVEGLILVQHCALVLAQTWLVGVAAQSWRARWWAAAFLVVCPIAPCFAQCVGSETGGIIAVYAFAASVLWLIRSIPQDRWWHWVIYCAALYACLQSRHVYVLYAAIVPFAMLAPLRGAQLRPILLALAWTLLALIASWATVKTLCVRYHIEPVSSMGYTFQWRLLQIHKQPRDMVDSFVERIVARLPEDDVETKEALRAWSARGLNQGGSELEVDIRRMLRERGHKDFFVESRRRLNRLARLVLWPPDPCWIRSVGRDLWTASLTPLSNIAATPPATTAQLIDRLNDQKTKDVREHKLIARLDTFANYSRRGVDSVRKAPLFRAYVDPWGFVPLGIWFLAAASALVVLATNRRPLGEDTTMLLAMFGFLAVGLGITLANTMVTMFTEITPRYGLPLWQNSQIVLLVATVAISRKVFRRAATKVTD
ncbi:MAG: hypothetical protein FGM15_08730 [Chthoniobacterales bacterium]|nr:hypothetical protein [Chthoniobacterales bacterium]